MFGFVCTQPFWVGRGCQAKNIIIIMVLNPFSAGIDFRRQNLTAIDVRFSSLMLIPAPTEQDIYTIRGPIA